MRVGEELSCRNLFNADRTCCNFRARHCQCVLIVNQSLVSRAPIGSETRDIATYRDRLEFKACTQNLRFIYAHQLIPLTVRAGIQAKATAKPPVVDSGVLNLAALGAQYAEGAQMEGWIVTGKIGEQGFGNHVRDRAARALGIE